MTLTTASDPHGASPLFTHLVNPFTPRAASQELAQKATFAAIRNAIEYAKNHGVEAEALGVVLPEDAQYVEPPTRPVPALKRTVMDLGTFTKKRAYPLFGDVLQAAYEHGRGKYVIFSNIDIAPQREFYVEVKKLIDDQQGADPMYPFIITRRSLLTTPYHDVSELEAMYKDRGSAHPGYDCFIFPREWIPRMKMAGVVIGAWWFTEMLLANLDTLSRKRTLVYTDLYLTFHIGDDPQWLGMDEYWQHNAKECGKAVKELHESEGFHPFGSWLDWVEIKIHGPKPRLRRIMIEWRNHRNKKKIARQSGHQAY